MTSAFPFTAIRGLEAAWMVVPLILALGHVCLGRGHLRGLSPRAARHARYLRHRQAVDVESCSSPTACKEINELHVPVGRNIRLILASEDVIHDFFVPAFRVKMDVVPGHYNTMWFRPTKAGRYHFFCSQYCGTNHAFMGGWVTVMEPSDYAAWLSGSTAGRRNPVVAGEKLFAEKACSTCHLANGTGRAPSLNGMYGAQGSPGGWLHCHCGRSLHPRIDSAAQMQKLWPGISH